jgi:hypothetical protein
LLYDTTKNHDLFNACLIESKRNWGKEEELEEEKEDEN